MTIANGKSGSEDGAIYSDGSDITVRYAVFTGNYAPLFGGAVSVKNGSLTVENSSFVGNSSYYSGGAISSVNGDLTVQRIHILRKPGRVRGSGFDLRWWCHLRTIIRHSSA